MATKKEADGEHPGGHYLVVEDAEKPSTWHLRVRGPDGKPDHHLMGAAWAALHGGYRGNKYEGPNPDAALEKLKALYKSEGMDLPSETAAELVGAYHELMSEVEKYAEAHNCPANIAMSEAIRLWPELWERYSREVMKVVSKAQGQEDRAIE
jgi:type VI protein secretion system component VasK